MAMTLDEIMELQAKILAARTDTSTNPNMKYSKFASRNTGLNPEYFKGNDTKIVNALNTLYKKTDDAADTAKKTKDKLNEIVLDTELNVDEWTKLKGLMDQNTIVEGLVDLYENKLPNSSGAPTDYATEEDIDSIINKLK